MSDSIKIKNSDLLNQILNTVNTLEHRYYKEDMLELNTLLTIPCIKTQRVKNITTFLDKKSKELIKIDKWNQYIPQNLSVSIFNDLKNELELNDENFILSNAQLLNFTGEKSYPHAIASITVLLRILTNLNKLLIDESTSAAQEPLAVYGLLTKNKYSSPLRWNGSNTAFIELVASLYEIGSIVHVTHVLTRKELFDILSNMLNLHIKDAESKLSRAKRRKKNETPFLDILRAAFINLCMRKTSQ